MDQFYLHNAALYQALVKRLSPAQDALSARGPTETASPDLIVTTRIRPLLDDEAAEGFPSAVFPRSVDTGVVDIHDLYNHPRGRPILKSFNYEVDRVYNSQTTTEEIFENQVSDLISFAWNGGIGTLFACGQTGSGKTFTISRLQQLVVESLMDGPNRQRQIYISIIDLAGNSAYDLLNSRQPISILEDSFGVTQWAGAKEFPVQDRDEVMDIIERAVSFRRTASTVKNHASSRSHSICRIRIEDQSTNISDGLLYLIDLAGSEAARDIAVHGADRMRETREINMSLSVLKDCIRGKVQLDALKEGPKSKQKKPHIPFRQSALTKVLKHVFDPAGSRACKTVVVACINPSLADVGPSKNTLRYAEMLRVLIPATDKRVYNAKSPITWTNAQLQDWIAKNSGNPIISSAALVPNESGAQALRLTAAQFESRCLKSPGVSIEQAKALRSKLWQMHIDSRRVGDSSNTHVSNPSESTESGAGLGRLEQTGRSSSRDPFATIVPFKERIRPGMIISWKNKPLCHGSTPSIPEALQLAVVLSPLEAVQDTIKDGSKDMENPTRTEPNGAKANGADNGGARYVCALVTSGLMAEAYELNLWRQVVIDVGMMDKEVVLEYDTATRTQWLELAKLELISQLLEK